MIGCLTIFGSPLVSAAVVSDLFGTWNGTWFVDEVQDEFNPPIPLAFPVDVQLDIGPFDSTKGNYGTILFDTATPGVISSISVVGKNVEMRIDYPWANYEVYGTVTGVLTENTIVGDFDEMPAAGYATGKGALEITKILTVPVTTLPNIGFGEGREVLKIEGCGKDNNYAMMYGIKFKPDDKWVLDILAGRYSGKYEVVIPDEKISLSLNERSGSKLYDYIQGAASSLCRANVKIRSPKVKKFIIKFNDDLAEVVLIVKFKSKDGTTKSKSVFKAVIDAGYTQ